MRDFQSPQKFERPPFWNEGAGLKRYGVYVNFNGMTEFDKNLLISSNADSRDRRVDRKLISSTFFFY
jgi:hypothetical protein